MTPKAGWSGDGEVLASLTALAWWVQVAAGISTWTTGWVRARKWPTWLFTPRFFFWERGGGGCCTYAPPWDTTPNQTCSDVVSVKHAP